MFVPDSGVRTAHASCSTGTGDSAHTTPPRTVSTDSRTNGPPERQISVPTYEPAFFDQLFENGGKVQFPCPLYSFRDSVQVDSIDEGVGCSFEKECSQARDIQAGVGVARGDSTVGPQVTRVDSVMLQPFTEMLAKNWQRCQGFYGFRRRLANDINHKYCSYCRIDDVIFLFLHIVFGMVSMSAGWLGYVNCEADCVSYYLLCEGLLSVFVFPISIMEWTTRVGGCVNEDQKLDRGVWFGLVFLLRLLTVSAGTALLVLESEKPSAAEEGLLCTTMFTIFTVGVVLDWAVLLLVLLLPLCLFAIAYYIAGWYYDAGWYYGAGVVL